MRAFKFGLGDRVKDKVTGMSGIVVGRGDHISGCDTYGVQSETLKDGAPVDVKWFDEPRIELVLRSALATVDERVRKTGADSVPQATTQHPTR